MALLNWSMTMVGYPPHARSASRVVGLTHMSTHEALNFADNQGMASGWLLVEGSQPQLERVQEGTRVGVSLREMLSDSRVSKTEGVASGSVFFVAGDPATGKPPADRSLIAWAEERRQPWVEVIDNDAAYWGGLSDAQIERLCAWFLCRRPAEQDWRKVRIEPRLAGRLRHGLVEHGWTRNLELVKTGRRLSCDLWGGVHRRCILDHANSPAPAKVQIGLRLTLEDGQWLGKDIEQRCLLSDDTGKLQFGSGYYSST
jgi:hypothetical protein